MRYDLCSPRKKKDGGTFWHRVGTMFADDRGGFSIMLDSLPLPDAEGRLIVKAFVPRDRGQAPQQQQGGGGRPASDDFGDEIPFSPEWR